VYIKSRGKEYINAFLNKPQEMLPATAMPRVGLNEKSQEQILTYLESIGDAKKAERESMGIYFILYFLFLSVIAYLWKRKIFSEVH
jgi:ubiquinol-cytochrome c reductase cytochrome c1 subunit